MLSGVGQTLIYNRILRLGSVGVFCASPAQSIYGSSEEEKKSINTEEEEEEEDSASQALAKEISADVGTL